MMKGNKWLTLLLALCMLLMLAAGCADNSEDILAMVGETPVYRWYYNAYLSQQMAMFQEYSGKDLTAADANKQELLEYKKFRLEDLAAEAAMLDKARTLGLTDLTAEQEAEIDQQYLDYYNGVLNSYKAQYGTDAAALRKAEQAYDQLLKESGLTPERIRETIRYGYITSLYNEHAGLTVSISEEDVRQQYNAMLLEQQQKFDADPALFADEPASIAVYMPAGYKKTFRLLKAYSAQQQDDIIEATDTLKEAKNAYMLAVLESGSDSSAAKKAEAEAAKATTVYQNVLNRITDSIVSNKLDTAITRLNNGEDFITVMEQETDDAPIPTLYVREGVTSVDVNYLPVALSLAEPGDYSEPVATNDGVCLIYLAENVTPGPVPFEEVRDEIELDMRSSTTFQSGLTTNAALLKEAQDAGTAEIFYDKLEK